MAEMKYKSVKQLEREEYKCFSCDNCKWANAYKVRCMKFDIDYTLIHCCKDFEVRTNKQQCDKCIYYNSRKNAKSKCKIGIYNCKGVVSE